MKTYSLEKLTDKYIGKRGTKKRNKFDSRLRLDLSGQATKQGRQGQKPAQKKLKTAS